MHSPSKGEVSRYQLHFYSPQYIKLFTTLYEWNVGNPDLGAWQVGWWAFYSAH